MLKQFFIICSGSDRNILETCSNGEQNKFAGIGATIFFTALMAFIASSYALYTVFDNYSIAIAFGLVWGLLIFNLDRFIVSTIKKRDRKITTCLQATPRLILAVIIAIVISKPLELKIFEKEINQVLLDKKNKMTLENQQEISKQFTPEINDLKEQIQTLENNISVKEADVNALYKIYIEEAEGVTGTKLLGKGPVYQEKRDKHDAELADLKTLKAVNKTKIDNLNNQIIDLQNKQESKIKNTQPIINNSDGLMARINALQELPWLPSFFIFLLFLVIETAPILTKLLASKGPYDYKLEDAETTVSTWEIVKINERQNITNASRILNKKIYSDIYEENDTYTYKRNKAKELMRLQADAFFQHQKEAL
ncbi:DUF4407 domain-containing protein [Bizionia sp. KMM 8389]